MKKKPNNPDEFPEPLVVSVIDPDSGRVERYVSLGEAVAYIGHLNEIIQDMVDEMRRTY